jgi:hypothetical protein
LEYYTEITRNMVGRATRKTRKNKGQVLHLDTLAGLCYWLVPWPDPSESSSTARCTM